jgi:hypothetical protein
MNALTTTKYHFRASPVARVTGYGKSTVLAAGTARMLNAQRNPAPGELGHLAPAAPTHKAPR